MVNYIGYKGFDKDLKCIDFQYEIGKSYEMDENPLICTRGFHYCGNLRDIFDYKSSKCRICIVKAYGDVNTDGFNKSCTNKIEILKEINISKEDRIRYVYANEHGLIYPELRDILSKEFILDEYINDLRWVVREAVADQGYGLDKLVNDSDWRVRAAVAKQGYGLDKLIDDADWYVRRAVAKQGYGLDKLINDLRWSVRAEVAKQKYGLDILINDPSWIVKVEVAKQKYGLDILINDPSWIVREAVAKQGYGLDVLVDDEFADVRIAVAEQGYGLDKLINDADWYVRRAVAKQGYGLDKLVNDSDWRVRAAVAKQGYGLDILINDKDCNVREVAQSKNRRKIRSNIMVNYIGYKGFDKDLKCIDFQYEIGKSYEMDENPEICTRGYHYCSNLRDIFRYKKSDCRICIIKAYGDVNSGNYSKFCTNKIEILKEINISKEDRIRYVYANWYDLSDAKLRDILSEEFILDKYINISRWPIKEAVAKQGYGLDILINDEDPDVRIAVVNQGYGLDVLINDPDWRVRCAVANYGYGLDKLSNDPDWRVREVAVDWNYGLDKLINDEDPYIRDIARAKLNKK